MNSLYSIYNTSSISSYKTQPQTYTAQATTEMFQDVLKRVSDTQEIQHIVQPVQKDITKVKEIELSQFKENQITHQDVFDHTLRLVDRLDRYSKELMNPSRALKDIEPIIDEINVDAEELMAEMTSINGTDDLKTIASECLVAASTEYLKFKRGDYV
ncbi:MAG: hypothetical protein HQK77_09505 [Desulfobacterales bacterium]|nr:hypothetical protein [Desulfobacterales bacterium]